MEGYVCYEYHYLVHEAFDYDYLYPQTYNKQTQYYVVNNADAQLPEAFSEQIDFSMRQVYFCLFLSVCRDTIISFEPDHAGKPAKNTTIPAFYVI